ncbi:MAG: hypothetical protein J7L44_00115 [Candidatus Diapherotrites archaeon]|nr:hypothetical protein [Candidatus Diapherotrites archaeon]
MAGVMDVIVGSLLTLIGLVVWTHVYNALNTEMLGSSVTALIALIPLLVAAGFLIRGFLGMFSGQ